MKLKIALALFSLLLIAASAKSPPGPVKHYIVLMMENRAFDHLLGYAHSEIKGITGLTGLEFNHWNVSEPQSPKIHVSQHATDITPNPPHTIPPTTIQIFGNDTSESFAHMNGFVEAGRLIMGDTDAPTVMTCWHPKKVPIITSLAKHFTLFDHWFSSVPGPTFANRLYFHSGTSDGTAHNFYPETGFHQKTLYESLDEAGYDWAFYAGSVTDSSFFNYTRQLKFHNRLHHIDNFGADVALGKLPTVTFICPRFISEDGHLADDQHPAHAVSIGEGLIKQIYENIRSSPLWNSSAFLLTYDEHGGFYDHVPTPIHDVPNPDGKVSDEPPFKFDRLGVRVPTILVSPWVDKAVIHHPTQKPSSSSKYEHSSFIHTVRRMLGIKEPLTKREAWAAPFDHLFNRATPRTDCPMTLPEVYYPSVEAYKKAKLENPEHLQPVNDLQIEYLQVTNTLLGLEPNANLDTLKTEQDAANYARKLMKQWKTEGEELYPPSD